MNALEILEGKLALTMARLHKLEIAFLAHVGGSDAEAAQGVAERLGFGVDVILMPSRHGGHRKANAQKRQLAQQLAGKGWPPRRIARVLQVDETTVRRWSKPAR